MQKQYWLGVGLVVLTPTLIILYKNNPSCTQWSPKCLMYQITGYKCPGCGIQRFFFNFLHGNFQTAISYNYFAALVLPYLILLLGVDLLPKSQYSTKLIDALSNKNVAYLYMIMYVIWWIIRNIINV